MLGIPFSKAFGPQTRCWSGHVMEEVGWKWINLKSGTKTRRCLKCYSQQTKKYNLSRDKARKAQRAASREPSKDKPGMTLTTMQRHYRSNIAANAILALHEKKDRCATHWERSIIQLQIDELAKRISKGEV